MYVWKTQILQIHPGQTCASTADHADPIDPSADMIEIIQILYRSHPANVCEEPSCIVPIW